MAEQEATQEKQPGARPVLSSANKAGGITLWVNDEPKNDKSPDLTGFIQDGDNQIRVSGWLRPGGEKDGKPYGPFVGLAMSERDGAGWKSTNIGALHAMNNYKGEPVDPTKRSRMLGDVTIGEKKLTVTGFANDELLSYDGLDKALGFTGAVVTKSPEAPAAEADAPAEQKKSRGPKPN